MERAVSELPLKLTRSYVVGDYTRDMRLARKVGAKAVLLTSGRVEAQALEVLKTKQAMPDTITGSMAEAAEWILADATTSFASGTHRHGTPNLIPGSSVDR